MNDPAASGWSILQRSLLKIRGRPRGIKPTCGIYEKSEIERKLNKSYTKYFLSPWVDWDIIEGRLIACRETHEIPFLNRIH